MSTNHVGVIGRSHIGKELRWGGWPEGETFLLTGLHTNGILIGRMILDGILGDHATWHQGDRWSLVGKDVVVEEAALPDSIEPLMKEFGCREKQTRALVAAILKEVKEK